MNPSGLVSDKQKKVDHFISREKRGEDIENEISEVIKATRNKCGFRMAHSESSEHLSSERMIFSLLRKKSLGTIKAVIREGIRKKDRDLLCSLAVTGVFDIEAMNHLINLIIKDTREDWNYFIKKIKEEKDLGDLFIKIVTLIALEYYKLSYHCPSFLIEALLKEGYSTEEIVNDILNYVNDVRANPIADKKSKETSYKMLLVLLKNLFGPSPEVSLAAHAAATEGIKDDDFFIIIDSLDLFYFLVNMDCSIEEAVDAAKDGLNTNYRDIRKKSLKLLHLLEEKKYL